MYALGAISQISYRLVVVVKMPVILSKKQFYTKSDTITITYQ
jgi:hypothetical protein